MKEGNTYKVNHKVYVNKGNPMVLSLIEGTNKKILDVGCGAGDNARELIHKGHIVDGITLSDAEAEVGKAIMRNVYVHNLESGLPEIITEKYDYVICSHVLEHIAYPENLLADIRKQIEENGKLIVALPNLMHYKSRIQLLLGNFNYQDSGIWDYTHVRWYTFRTGQKLLIDNGYKIEKRFVDGDIPFLSLFFIIPTRVRQLVFKVLTKISRGMFGGQLIYTARP